MCRILSTVMVAVFTSHAYAGFTTEGLVAHLAFEEGSGPTSTDLTGNSHEARLIGTSWEDGYVSIPHDEQSAMIRIAGGPQMQVKSFTWDLWFEGGRKTAHGRICAQIDKVGGSGAEIMGLRDDRLGVRINNQGAVFDVPRIGTRSSEAPPDHWGSSVEPFHREAGPEHLILTHDAASRTVRLFVGLKAQPLKLTFESTYSGDYAVSDVPFAIGNIPAGGRVLAENVYQFSYYERALTYKVARDRSVTGGEIAENHRAGHAVSLAARELTRSPSQHYVSYQREPLLLVGESGTQVVMQNANIDYRQWIDDCADRGIRAAHIWSFVAPRQKQDGSVVEKRYGYVYPGLTPWARKSSGPEATDQLRQWDLQTFDEGPERDSTRYWPRLRDLCGYARKRDVVIGITVFFGWPKHDSSQRPDWSYHPFNVVNGGHLTANDDVQIIASPGTEVWNRPWSDDWPEAMKTQWVWERFCKKLIDDVGSLGNVFFVFMDEHSYSEGNGGDHFLRFFKKRGQVWVDWSRRRSAVDWVMSNTFSGSDSNKHAVSAFRAEPVRPYLNLEGAPYQGDPVRSAIWTFSIGGGHYFFHADERQETVTTGIMGYDPHVPDGDKGMYKRDWLGHASRFFNNHVMDLDALAPHNELSGPGTYCLAAPGREYVVYAKAESPRNFNLDLSAAAGRSQHCRFYDPRAGRLGEGFERNGVDSETFTKPDSRDWVLHVTVASKSSVREADAP